MLFIEENYFDDIEIDGENNVIVIDKLNNYKRNLPKNTRISSGSNNDFEGNCKVTIDLLDSGISIMYRNLFSSLEEADKYAQELSDLITKASNSKNSIR